MRATSNARFDARLSKEQKEFLEYAASLSGFKSLSEFVLYAAQQKANQIVEQNQIVLKTRRDQETFLKAISDDSSPNEKLKSTYENYKKGKAPRNEGNPTLSQTT
jgi:uncharacterized protein (DUF1778 family)